MTNSDNREDVSSTFIFKVDVKLSDIEADAIKQIIKYATLTEIARLDPSRDLIARPLKDADTGLGGVGGRGTDGFFISSVSA